MARSLGQYGWQAVLSVGGPTLFVTGIVEHVRSTELSGAAVSIVAVLAFALVEIVRIRTTNARDTAAAFLDRSKAREARAWGKEVRRAVRKLKPDSAQLQKLMTDSLLGAAFLWGHAVPPASVGESASVDEDAVDPGEGRTGSPSLEPGRTSTNGGQSSSRRVPRPGG